MPEPTAMVFVVEDDRSVREALASLIRSAGWDVETFESAQDFLTRPRADAPGCLVLDVGLPGPAIVINGNASLRWLGGGSPHLEEAREAIHRIVRDGQRAGDVITRLRSLFQRRASLKEALDLNEVVQEVIALTRSEVQKGGAAIHTRTSGHLPAVPGDRVQLQQVVLNLILNAVEAMSGVVDRPRAITIDTRRGEGEKVLVTVQDTGVGLDPESREKIFDAFYTSKSLGMGMGLAISRSIVEHHGGRLWAEANHGPGAAFCFTVPLGAGCP
ncbi:MAG TPA: ATP-binding protein [Gemmatimonadales bacterium]|nr:ATP-binding protein [Gemmatimonadales bacterium]